MATRHSDDARADGPSSSMLVGRCEMFDAIATGSMATIHLGRMLGAGGFARTVAIKRLHPQFALDRQFAQKLRDEARLLARVRHPNVVPMLDLVEEAGNVYLIMEYVEGIDLARLLEAARSKGDPVPPPVALRIGVGVLHGLHAAHEATDGKGELLKIVHRDVSPPNILVGTDGFTRLADFGTARALGQLATSRTGQTRRTSAYLSPEQVLSKPIDRRSDVFAAAAVIWQCLTGRTLFDAQDPIALIGQITEQALQKPSLVAPKVPQKWDGIVMRGLERPVDRRWKTAMAMADAIEAIGGLASQREVGDWVRRVGADRIAELSAKVQALEARPVRAGSSRGRVDPRSQLRIDPEAVAAARAEAERLAALSSAEVAALASASAEIEEPPASGPAVPAEPGTPSAGASPGDASSEGADESAPSSAPSAGPSPHEPSERAGDAGSSADRRARLATLTAVASSVTESRPRRRGRLWVSVAAAGVLGVVAVGWALGSRDEPAAGSGEPSAGVEPATTGIGGAPVTSAPAPTATSASAPTATASATATASTSTSSSAAAIPSGQPTTRTTATRTATRPGGLYSRD